MDHPTLNPDEIIELVRAKRRTTPDPVVCAFRHAATNMLHFDGRAAAQVVAPHLNIAAPTAPFAPTAPYGSLAIRQDAFAAKLDPARPLQVVEVSSIADLKVVQRALDLTHDCDNEVRAEFLAEMSEPRQSRRLSRSADRSNPPSRER